MLWYNDLAADVQERVNSLNWEPLLLGRPFEVTSRPKTLDTLRDKLIRDPSTPLQNVQDIAGVRFEAQMSLDEQDGVVNAICGLFGHDLDDRTVRDMRASPHSGYRAVHIWLRLPARVEIQVRTHLQGLWANTYELVADVLGREIRYDGLPAGQLEREVVEGLRAISMRNIADIERDRNEISTLEVQLDDARRQGLDPPLWLRRRLAKKRRRMAEAEAELQVNLTTAQEVFESMRSGRS
jgi:ppGpp synthetase/RelA/SpoT-type nucleotidyltranferase